MGWIILVGLLASGCGETQATSASPEATQLSVKRPTIYTQCLFTQGSKVNFMECFMGEHGLVKEFVSKAVETYLRTGMQITMVPDAVAASPDAVGSLASRLGFTAGSCVSAVDIAFFAEDQSLFCASAYSA
jgi:hypothetical protein